MTREEEVRVLASKVFTPIGQHASLLGTTQLSGFLGAKGAAYDGSLMIVGRATNGWNNDSGTSPSCLTKPDEVMRYARSVGENATGGSDCSMRWVVDQSGNDSYYNTNRSAFWRSARQVLVKLEVVSSETIQWSSSLYWTNLYKAAPRKNGNPSVRLKRAQLQGCIELLHLELSLQKPKRILFMTGMDWVEPFLGRHEIGRPIRSKHVQGIGQLYGAKCVVASHPQCKPQDEWVGEVVNAFHAL